jgi:PAP2 superfamily
MDGAEFARRGDSVVTALTGNRRALGRMGAGRGARLLFALTSILPAMLGAQGVTTPDSVKRIRVGRADVVRRDSTTGYAYTRPRPFHAVTDVPKALGTSARDAFRPSNIPAMIGVAASTAVLIAADEQVLAETRRLASRIDLPQNHPSANVRVGPFKQPFPTTVGSGLYFLGDGMASVFVAAGFAARGSLADDMRARRTASEVIEALLVSGTVTQTLKHVAGRQTPSEATVPRGRWRPFPKLSDYSANVPAYDAFPSGHLASTMATLTVVAMNYHEHKFIWPVSAATIGVLAFTMVNNGVHWASDYPLALAIGGVVGKAVATRGRTVVRMPTGPSGDGVRAADRSRLAFDFTPIVGPGMLGVRVTW